jgi:hypothetical protein
VKNIEDDKPVSDHTETRAIPTMPVTGTHTPGPWQLWHDDEGAFVLRSPDDEKVICKRDLGLPDRDEGIANAHLIAAAPTLLDALTLCAHVFREFPEEFNPETWAHVRHTALTVIDEAIAKAEGRPC